MASCKNLVVTCMDYRLPERLAKKLKEVGLLRGNERFDLLTIPGAVKALTSVNDADATRVRYLMNDLALAKASHSVRKVILLPHTNCAAYCFPASWSLKEQILALCKDLHVAKRIIRNMDKIMRGDNHAAYYLKVVRGIAVVRGEELVEIKRLD